MHTNICWVPKLHMTSGFVCRCCDKDGELLNLAFQSMPLSASVSFAAPREPPLPGRQGPAGHQLGQVHRHTGCDGRYYRLCYLVSAMLLFLPYVTEHNRRGVRGPNSNCVWHHTVI